MPDDESGGRSGSGSLTPPRVGGIDDDGVPWVGGSTLAGNSEPQDVLCYRPTTFKEKQRQHGDLKRGLEDNNKLDFVD